MALREPHLEQPGPGAADPVCGMTVDPASAQHHLRYHGRTYFFCSRRCRDKFSAAPETYLRAAPPAAAGAALWTCPMHPQILRAAAGSCPLCGMALEPSLPPAGDEPNPELAAMAQRFWIALSLSLPLLLLVMADGFFGGLLTRALSARGFAALQLALATPVVLWGGWPFFHRGWQSLVNRNLNMFTLIAIGTGVAYADSIVATLLPGIFPPAFRGADGRVESYFEAAAVIVTLVLLGQVLELRARAHTNSAIRALLDLSPKLARLRRADGSEADIPLAQVQRGDHLRIRPGETVPVDGIVLDGHGAVDELLITGEPLPAEKSVGDQLTGATLNTTGSLVMRADRVGAETLLARIVAMVALAQRSRAPIQRLVDQVSAWFVPAVILIAVASFVLWSVYGPPPAMAFALVNAVAVLIIACPCALGLATPMSIMVGIGRGAGAGVLVRNAEALELMEKVDTLVIDKTGTLTEGKPRLVGVVSLGTLGEDELLRLVASLERASEHPLAAAITAGALARQLPLGPVSDFRAKPGEGVTGTVDGKRVGVGSLALLAGLGVDPGGLPQQADARRGDGQTVMLVAVDGAAVGLIAVADPIKANARAALQALAAVGIRIVMMTGDSRTTALAVGRQLGIAEVAAELLPDQKAAAVKTFQDRGHVVAMAGDGINDAPALAQAEVGIAMGTGADVALASAAVTLLKGDLDGIVRARRLSRATMSNIRQNLFFAFLFNALAVPIAAGVLYPWCGLLLNPMIASAAMSVSSLAVIANSLRLRHAAL